MQIKRSTPFALRDDYIEHTHTHTAEMWNMSEFFLLL